MAADDQLSSADVARMAGITTGSLYRARSTGTGDVPAPDGHIGVTPWWYRSTIENWIATRRNRPGRPRKEGTA